MRRISSEKLDNLKYLKSDVLKSIKHRLKQSLNKARTCEERIQLEIDYCYLGDLISRLEISDKHHKDIYLPKISNSKHRRAKKGKVGYKGENGLTN